MSEFSIRRWNQTSYTSSANVNWRVCCWTQRSWFWNVNFLSFFCLICATFFWPILDSSSTHNKQLFMFITFMPMMHSVRWRWYSSLVFFNLIMEPLRPGRSNFSAFLDVNFCLLNRSGEVRAADIDGVIFTADLTLLLFSAPFWAWKQHCTTRMLSWEQRWVATDHRAQLNC